MSLKEGLVWMPYVTATTNAVISDVKRTRREKRMDSINKIFNLGLEKEFSPRKLINSRYSAVNISNSYKYLTINFG
jgi:hypothetical protein